MGQYLCVLRTLGDCEAAQNTMGPCDPKSKLWQSGRVPKDLAQYIISQKSCCALFQ